MIPRCRISTLAVAVLALLVHDRGPRAFAAPPPPARWELDGLPKQPLAPGATIVLTLSAHIEPGWHIYALDEPEGGPIATQIGLAENDPLMLLAVDGPEPRMVPDPVLHQPTGMFQNAVRFKLRLRAPRTPLPLDAVSHILVRYQSCNDRVCLPPHTDTLTFPLKGPGH
jgi:DsbC/DsbD-like thiol-disulfide interchange protein